MIASQKLTRKQLEQLEQELVRERARLERALDIENASETASLGVVTRLPASEESGIALALATRSHVRYAAVVNAFARLAAGTYGTCTSCTSAIPFGRLLVMPEAASCVTCSPRL